MEYTALITRVYPMAEEALEVIVDSIGEFSDFRKKVLDVLRICDYRGNLQAQRLFEDTQLIDELSNEELITIRGAIELLYPPIALPDSLDLTPTEAWRERKNKSSFQITKNIRDGEILKVFFYDVAKDDDLGRAIQAVYSLVDERLTVTNERYLVYDRYLKRQDVDTRMKITMFLSILYRQANIAQIIQQLRGQHAEETVSAMRDELGQESERVHEV